MFARVRRYTRQLLEAVACLHEHGVVHRDIKVYNCICIIPYLISEYSDFGQWKYISTLKGANIFLTEELKTLKLGDFGCAVKIKAHTTMPGELQVNYVLVIWEEEEEEYNAYGNDDEGQDQGAHNNAWGAAGKWCGGDINDKSRLREAKVIVM